MITIDQLLESVDLFFEPRWITKDEDGTITLFRAKPEIGRGVWVFGRLEEFQIFGKLKLAEFENKDWKKCIYEVPKKPTDKIEKLDEHAGNMQLSSASMTRNQFVANTIMKKINELVDEVNELKGEKNE